MKILSKVAKRSEGACELRLKAVPSICMRRAHSTVLHQFKIIMALSDWLERSYKVPAQTG